MAWAPGTQSLQALRDLVESGRETHGLFLQMGSAVAAEVAGRAGFNWAVIDLEHGVGAESDLLPQLLALAATATPAVIRIESASRLRVGRALDLGAAGIMAPRMDSRIDAEEFVSWLRYPPSGSRGVGFSARGAGYAKFGHADVAALNRAVVGIAQIETREGVADVDAIAAVDGIDVLFVGPSDLSHSLGVPGAFDHAVYEDALHTIRRAATQHRRALGVHLPSLSELGRYRALGFTFLSVEADGRALSRAFATTLETLQQSTQ